MLNNMKYWLHNFLFNTSALKQSSSTSAEIFTKRLTDIDGSQVSYYNANKLNEQSILGLALGSSDIDKNGVTIRLGTGTNTPTKDETVSLENDITSQLTFGGVTSIVDYPRDRIRLLLRATFTNNTNEEITVTEAGFVVYIYYYTTSTSWVCKKVLLDRKSVADGNFTPVTVGAGESKIFVYALEL